MTFNKKREGQQLMHSYTETLLEHEDQEMQRCLLAIEEATFDFTSGGDEEFCNSVFDANIELIEMLNPLSLAYDHYSQFTFHPWLDSWKMHLPETLLQELSQVLFMCPSDYRHGIYNKIEELLRSLYRLKR